jgi:D-beta-D-heptose 7-phosphate kinase/D-beta-D-heptose 1-phosphate adenosyltransferase
MQTRLLEATRRRFLPVNSSRPMWALVVGDLMLDRYLWGKVERISPEAPVPVVLIEKETVCPGGASNVAANLISLGVSCALVGCVGKDATGPQLIELLQKTKIGTQGVVTLDNYTTITKTRVIGGHQQMIRLDSEPSQTLQPSQIEAVKAQVSNLIAQNPSIVVISDYAKGMLTPELCQLIIQAARAREIPVLVDPKGRDYSKYKGATALTPNLQETAEACGVSSKNADILLPAAGALRQRLELKFLAVTRSEAGISLLEADRNTHIPATAKQVFDVSGAGDTVIATLAAGMVAGLNPEEALHLANLAAGIVVGKVGTAPVTTSELLSALSMETSQQQADKICSWEQLAARLQQWQGKKIVFTNGCFDLLHAGHVTYLEQARKLGDKLIVGLNSDRSVTALKGPGRPIIHEADRARVLAALEAVDAVVLFDQDTPLQLINQIKPQVLVKGNDYSEQEVVGGTEVKSWGGTVALVAVVPGHSSSRIIEKIQP